MAYWHVHFAERTQTRTDGCQNQTWGDHNSFVFTGRNSLVWVGNKNILLIILEIKEKKLYKQHHFLSTDLIFISRTKMSFYVILVFPFDGKRNFYLTTKTDPRNHLKLAGSSSIDSNFWSCDPRNCVNKTDENTESESFFAIVWPHLPLLLSQFVTRLPIFNNGLLSIGAR